MSLHMCFKIKENLEDRPGRFVMDLAVICLRTCQTSCLFSGYFKFGMESNSWFLSYSRPSWYCILSNGYSQKEQSDATNKKYDSYFSKFKSWCRQFNLEYLPAKASTVTIYLTRLIQAGCSVSVLNSNFYAVKWYHDMHLFNDPCSNKLVNNVLEGAKECCQSLLKRKNLLLQI